MRETEYRAWLGAQGQAPSTISTRLSDARRVEAHYSELDEAFDLDRCESLLAGLRYTAADRAAGRPNPSKLEVDGDVYDSLGSYRSAITTYCRFRDESGSGAGESIADRIRRYVGERLIDPARARGDTSISIRAGDVHDALRLERNWRNVCQVLRGAKLREALDLPDPRVEGPIDSSTTTFIFDLRTDQPDIHNHPATAIASEAPMPTNLILYGPPGTGKTFATAAEAVRLCGEGVPNDRDALMAAYRRLADAGRIEFVTFHQSMAYEDFVEGLRPVQNGENGAAGFELKPMPGIFRRIARRAETSTGPGTAPFSIGARQVFKMSIGEASNPDDAHLFEDAIAGGYTILGFEDIDWSDDRYTERQAIIDACRTMGVRDGEPTAVSGRVQMPFIFRNWVNQGDLIVVSKGNGLFRAIGEFTGDYRFVPREEGGYAHRRDVRWLWVDRTGVPVDEIYLRGFTMKSIYVLTRADLNIPALERYANSQREGGLRAPEPFVLIIDEINRANISKVFGELITLLEPDKRLGASNEIKVRLPYSHDSFGVPANLHIVGTMNTADRSIALLDTALRRRFEFRELMPDPNLQELKDAGIACGVDLPRLLTVINDRIEYLFDREHQIGHAYFIGCKTVRELDAVMRHKVIPLLAEYFHEDWGKVAAVLGDPKGERFLERQELKAPPGLDDEDSEPRWRWLVRDPFAGTAYDAIA